MEKVLKLLRTDKRYYSIVLGIKLEDCCLKCQLFIPGGAEYRCNTRLCPGNVLSLETKKDMVEIVND